MSTTSVLWIVLSAAGIFAAGPAAGEPWRALEQPELKEALEQAPALQTESLGEPARGVNVWERWLVPNPDGKSWDVLQIYFKEYYGPTWLYAVDLGTGQVSKQRLADGHQFYLSGRALGFDGKYYIATPSRKTWSMDLFVYDPATNTLHERGEIVPGLGGEVRPLVTGPDGRIYGTGTRGNQVGLYIYDPNVGKVVKDFGAVGPSHPNGAWSRYVMGVDDTHAYIASGMIPAWYLVAVNLETGEQNVLLESPTERVMDIIESFPSAYARVPQDGGAPSKEYWLYHGQAIAKTDDTPPWPRQASPWDKAVPKPEVYFDQIDPDAQSNATLWHRPRENAASRARGERGGARQQRASAAQWNSVRLEDVPSYPHRINPMSLLPDGRLYGTGDDYAGVFVFDPRTDQTTILGPRPGLAPYTQILCGGKLYSSGYSGGHLFVYDPSRPWTLSKGGPPGHPAIDQADAQSNPRYLGDFDRTTRVGLMHSSALGADGRIYFGGFGLRHYTGGGFGWYDPKTQKMDGFWEPLSGYAVQWIAPALDGKLIVISTIRAPDELKNNQMPDEARLFVYDVSEQKIVRQIAPIAKGRTTGLIAEVAPGRLLGLTSNPDGPGSILYGVDLVAGDVLFAKNLPSPISVDDHWPHWVDPSYEYNAFVRGPDEFVWTYLRDVLVRIDPKDASVHVVGKIDPVGWPTFVGNDVYFSGPEQLRRIRNIVPARQAKDTLPDARVVQLPEGALVPDIAMDGAGVLHMVYGLGDDAWYVSSSDNGRTFCPPVKVNTEGKVTLKMGERGPKLALGKSGSIHVVWADQWSPGVKVYPRYSRSLDGGKTFEPPRALASLFGIDGLTVAADGEGNVITFFHQVTAGQRLEVPEAHRLYLARSTDNGATFGPEQRMKIDGMDDLACSMCMMRARITADGNVCLALRVANDNIRDFFLLRSPKGDNAFTPLRVNEDRWELKKCPMCGPELTLNPEGRMLCAFMSRHRVYWSALDEGRFSLHVATPANENDEIYPAAFGDGKGHVLMVWQVGPMAVGRTAIVKWALYSNDGAFTGQQGTIGVSTSGTKPTAFVGTDGAFYIVTTAKQMQAVNYARPFEPIVKPALLTLPPGAVEPAGWLRDWAQAARDGITGHLDERHPTFADGWKGVPIKAPGAKPDGTGWPIEQSAYWLDGALRLGLVLHDEVLIQKIRARLDPVVEHVNQAPVGTSLIYWKPDTKPEEFDSWAHSQMGRALVALYDGTRDQRVLDALVKVYAVYPAKMGTLQLGGAVSGLCNLEAMLETYSFSGDRRILERALQAMAQPEVVKEIEAWKAGRLSPGHMVILYENIRLPGLAYPWSGDPNQLQATLGAFKWLDENHMLPYGVASGEEFASGIGAFRKTETCDVTAMLLAASWMYRIQGQGDWGDRMERAFFNAGAGPVARDFRTMCYYQSPNRLRSDSLPCEQPLAPGPPNTRFTALGCPNVLCCVGALNRIIPNYIIHMWMATRDNGLAATLYGPCTVSAKAGEGVAVKISTTTDYPFGETIRMKVEPAKAVSFPLYFRIPGWCKNPHVTLNGTKLSVAPDAQGFAKIARTWDKGDAIELQLPMEPKVLRGYETEFPSANRKYFSFEPAEVFQPRRLPYASVLYGPLLMALPIADIDPNTPVQDAKWQYALDTDAANGDAGITVERRPMPASWDWPLDAPVWLRVPAQSFDWRPTDAQALPEKPVTGTASETVRLVPYGCTKFRISMFPVTPRAWP